MKRNFSQGAIAILVVILILTFSLFFLAGGSLVGLDAKNTAKNFLNNRQAKYLANACAQEALLKLKQNSSYSGNESVLMGSQSCQILTLENLGPEQRIIKTQSSVGEITQKMKVTISDINPNLMISSWDENASF